VEFVHDIVSEREAEPVLILPGKMGIDDLRRPMHAFGLKSGSGIRPLFLAIQAVEVPIAGLHALRDGGMVTEFLIL
jgi:hypothetical protein